jgi:hypothetical protein
MTLEEAILHCEEVAKENFNRRDDKKCIKCGYEHIQLAEWLKELKTYREMNKEENYMELKDTVDLMNSNNWKDRFLAEYLQTKIRYEKLHKLAIKREVGKLEFDTPIPFDSWKEQLRHMGLYLYELEKQAAIHDIELPKV